MNLKKIALAGICVFSFACSTTTPQTKNSDLEIVDPKPIDPAPQASNQPKNQSTDVQQLQLTVKELTEQVGFLNDQVAALHAKVNMTQSALESKKKTAQATSSSQVHVLPHPSKQAGVKTTLAPSPSSEGFVDDESIQRYRSAKIFFDSKKYPEAVLEFASFLKDYPDHALAGASQYFMAESYRHQGESKLALKEFEHLLNAHSDSSYVMDTLNTMIDLETKLNLTQAADKHRQLLLSLFPSAAKAVPEAQQNPSSLKAPKIDEPPTAPIHEPMPEGQAG